MTTYRITADDFHRYVDGFQAHHDAHPGQPNQRRVEAGLQAVVDHVLATVPRPAAGETVELTGWPAMEYAVVHSVGAVNTRAILGWRVHTAHADAAGGFWFLLERDRPTDDDTPGAEATFTPLG